MAVVGLEQEVGTMGARTGPAEEVVPPSRGRIQAFGRVRESLRIVIRSVLETWPLPYMGEKGSGEGVTVDQEVLWMENVHRWTTENLRKNF